VRRPSHVGPERRLGELLEPSYVYTGPELLIR
jgi:hypothetical protein